MGSKMLTGSMLVFGPLLGFIMVFLEPRGTDEAKFAVAAQTVLDNSTLASIAGLGFTVAILAVTIGTSYLARSMQGEQKPGSDLAGLASVLALLAAAAFIASYGISMAMLDASWLDKGGDASTAIAIGDAIGGTTFLLMGGAALLLGIAIFRQKNLNQIVGGITALFGGCLLGGWIFPSSGADDIPGLIGFIGFLGWIIMTLALGILTVLSARKNAT